MDYLSLRLSPAFSIKCFYINYINIQIFWARIRMDHYITWTFIVLQFMVYTRIHFMYPNPLTKKKTGLQNRRKMYIIFLFLQHSFQEVTRFFKAFYWYFIYLFTILFKIMAKVLTDYQKSDLMTISLEKVNEQNPQVINTAYSFTISLKRNMLSSVRKFNHWWFSLPQIFSFLPLSISTETNHCCITNCMV